MYQLKSLQTGFDTYEQEVWCNHDTILDWVNFWICCVRNHCGGASVAMGEENMNQPCEVCADKRAIYFMAGHSYCNDCVPESPAKKLSLDDMLPGTKKAGASNGMQEAIDKLEGDISDLSKRVDKLEKTIEERTADS